MNHGNKDDREISGPTPEIFPAASYVAAPAFDPSEYLEDIAEFDLTEELGRELIEAVWSLVSMSARLSFNLDVCGLLFGDLEEALADTVDGATLVPSENTEMIASVEEDGA